MSKYKVQFQKGMSLQQFLSDFVSDDQCRETLLLTMRERDDTTPLSGAVQVCPH